MQQFEEARRDVLDRVTTGDLQLVQAAEILECQRAPRVETPRPPPRTRSRGARPRQPRAGSAQRRPDRGASTVVRLATTRYPGANHTHLAELLWEHRGLDLSNWTVRRILTRVGMILKLGPTVIV